MTDVGLLMQLNVNEDFAISNKCLSRDLVGGTLQQLLISLPGAYRTFNEAKKAT